MYCAVPNSFENELNLLELVFRLSEKMYLAVRRIIVFSVVFDCYREKRSRGMRTANAVSGPTAKLVRGRPCRRRPAASPGLSFSPANSPGESPCSSNLNACAKKFLENYKDSANGRIVADDLCLRPGLLIVQRFSLAF